MKTIYAILVILGVMATSVAADTTRILIGWDGSHYNSIDEGYRIGLALSGGGARGLAQVGILKAIEESGLKIDALAGTSIGGIIGGLYAAGYSADELEDIIRNLDFRSLFSNRPSRTSMLLTQRQEMERFLLSVRFDGFKPYIPQALTAGQRLSDLLTRLTLKANYVSGGDFDRLKIPFRAVTTDIVAGKEVIISRGHLADAMRSTMAFPLAFTGVESEERILMDGGMLDPIPVGVVRSIDNNLDVVVAVNTTSDLLPKEEIRDPIDIANQVTSIMTLDKLAAGLGAADIVITPEIEPYNSTDFDETEKLIEEGYRAGLKAVSQIRRKCKRQGNSDTLYLTDVEFMKMSPGFDTAVFPLQSGQLIDEMTIKELADSIYHKHELLSISTEVVSGDKAADGYKTAALRIEMIPRPYIRRLDFVIMGNSIFTDSTIIGIISNGDSLLSSEDILMLADSLETLYRQKGYDLAHIRRLNYLADLNVLEIDIDEAIIQRMEITGNERTKGWLIESNFPLSEGKPFNSKAAGRGIANIYATDLFERATINILPGTRGAIVRIMVKEKKFTQVRLGWHWDDEYRSEEFVDLLDDNLLGTGQEFLIHARYSNRRQKYEVSLNAHRFFSTYLTYRIKGFYHILDRRLYDDRGESTASVREDQYGFEFVAGQQIARFGTVTGEIRWNEVKNKYFANGTTDRIKLRTITLRSLVETINKYPFPTEGKKHLFYLQYATDILGGENTYTKLFSSVESYFPVTDGVNFHPRLAIGLSDTKYGIPVSEKYYVGGHYSFYGYRTDELVGAKMFLGNIELRYRLPYRFYISGRYDFGDVFTSVDHIKLRNIRHGYGFSLAFHSPVGPIDFGYGKSGNHPECYYIDVGLAF